MAQDLENGTTRYATDAPMREDKDSSIGVFQRLYLSLGGILQSPEFSKEPIRIRFLTTLLISLIPDPAERARILKAREDLLTTMESQYKEKKGIATTTILSSDQSNYLLVESSLQVIGLIVDYADTYIGKNQVNRMGYCIDEEGDFVPEEEGEIINAIPAAPAPINTIEFVDVDIHKEDIKNDE